MDKNRKKLIPYALITLSALVSYTQAADLVIAGRDDIMGQALDLTVEAYQEEYPNLEIELLKLPYGSLYERLVIGMREGDSSFDLVMIDDTWATEFMSSGWLAALDEDRVSQDFIPALVDISRYPVGQGPLFAIPVVGNVAMFAYRSDLMDEPESWTEVISEARRLNSEGTSGLVFRGQQGNPIVTGFLPMLWAYGGNVVDAEGEVNLNSPETVHAIRDFVSLREFAPQGVEVYNSGEVRDAIQQGRTAMAIEVWPSWVPSMDDPSVSNVVNQVEIIPAPGETNESSPMLGTWQMGISANADNAENAENFLAFFTSAEQQRTLALELGMPPTRTSAYNDDEVIAKYRWYPNQLNALRQGTARPRIQDWQQLESILGDYLQLALLGTMSPEQAAEQAHNRMVDALR
ncbi:MAG: ABC transporter substrate-binding protein [Natronospirillum sp.]